MNNRERKTPKSVISIDEELNILFTGYYCKYYPC